MNERLLLEEKIREFKDDHKMSHVEYGLPIAAVVNRSVAFCRNREVLNAYKREATGYKKKIITALVVLFGSLCYGITGCYLGLGNLAIVIGFWCIFAIGLFIHWKIEQQCKKYTIKNKDIIVYNGPDWMN